MNDYKELIATMNTCVLPAQANGGCNKCAYNCGDASCVTSLIEDAADAIEQLIKERDAAVADLAEQRVCHVCNHSKTHIDDDPCNSCGNQTRFEWRGVKKNSSESSELYRVVVSNISHERAYSLLNKLTFSGFPGAMVIKEKR